MLLAGFDDDERSIEQRQQGQVQMFEYAHRLGQEKRDNPQDDVWTILSNVEFKTNGGEMTALNQTELDLFFMLLVAAGSQTTRKRGHTGCCCVAQSPGPA